MRIVLFLTFALGGLVGCGVDKYAWNQCTTLVVETPDGIMTA